MAFGKINLGRPTSQSVCLYPLGAQTASFQSEILGMVTGALVEFIIGV